MLPLVIRGLMVTVVAAGGGVDALTVELDGTVLVPVDDVKRKDVDVTSRLNCPGCHVEAAQSLEATVMLTNEERRSQKPRSCTMDSPQVDFMLEAGGLGWSRKAVSEVSSVR
jgi:hypothetical protein